jgi:hypothetical protein
MLHFPLAENASKSPVLSRDRPVLGVVSVLGYSLSVYAESVRFRQSVINPIYKVYPSEPISPALADKSPRKFQRKFERNAKVRRTGIAIRWDCTPCVLDFRVNRPQIR